MHPAYSVIFFTTASGAGYGLLALMGLLGPAGLLPAERWFGVVALGLALGAISLGLLASTFHLGHPERAWRAVTQWRSSWLAREGVMAILTYGPAMLFAFGWVVLEKTTGWWGVWGAISAVCAFLTVVSTAMIYRSLKPIHQWCNSWTIAAYVTLGLMAGSLLLAAAVQAFGVANPISAGLPTVTVLAAWGVKLGYWRFIRTSPGLSTPLTATGLRFGTVRVVEHPHSEPNFVNKEMGYRVARKHADRLHLIAHGCAFALPLVLTQASYLLPNTLLGAVAAVLAVGAVGLGLLVERWLFFAEATHAANLYYGAERV